MYEPVYQSAPVTMNGIDVRDLKTQADAFLKANGFTRSGRPFRKDFEPEQFEFEKGLRTGAFCSTKRK